MQLVTVAQFVSPKTIIILEAYRDGRRYVACDVEFAPILPVPTGMLYVKTSLFTASLFTFKSFIKCSFSSQQ